MDELDQLEELLEQALSDRLLMSPGASILPPAFDAAATQKKTRSNETR